MGRKCTIFALFYFVFECKFQAPQGGLHLEGRFNGGFLRYDFGGLIFGRAYTWRGLFSEFYGNFLLILRLTTLLELTSTLSSLSRNPLYPSCLLREHEGHLGDKKMARL